MLWLWQNKKRISLSLQQKLWAQTAIIGSNLSPTPHWDTTMPRQPSTHPSRYKIELLKVLQLRITLLSQTVFKSSYFVWFCSIIRSQACVMSFKEKPTVHATVIWDSVTISNIFVLSLLPSKAGLFQIHASLSIFLAIDNI